MSYENIVRQYLSELREYIRVARTTGEATPELSYRPVLDRFLRTVSELYSPNVDVIFEPKLQGQSGRPDWRIYNTEDLGLYGFVEAKALDPDRPIIIDSFIEQITRYLGTGHRVILTDGLEFIFFDPSNIIAARRYCLVEKPLGRRAWRETANLRLMDAELREFFKESRFRQCSEEQLIREMAFRAARLSECVLALSQAPLGSGVSEEENRTIEILHDLQTTLRLHHDPVLEHPKVFADFVSQVLSFGLLYAHRVVAAEIGQPRDRYDAIRRFWADAVYATYTDRLIPFKALVEMLESELSPENESSSQIRCWYDDSRRLLAHVQLRDDQMAGPDYHILYEKFLTEFDPQTRFDFGAFYTPRELAGFTVGAAKAVIETRFQGRLLYEVGNKVIDPCCGTGTFIEQLVRHSENQAAIHLVGFEILPAPYALAHYRMAMLNVPNTPEHTIDIFLTNTLSDELSVGDDDHPGNVLREELRRAKYCARPPIVLVIGNPPSSDSFGPHSTGPNFSNIDALLMDFRPSAPERRTRQNTQKQIGNDFMKFLRWAADSVLASEVGVLALVLPSTFAAHPTYHHARGWLLRHFSEFWVLDIDRDLRTGVRSSSLFNSQQGRMLLIAPHTGTVPVSLEGRLHYAAITDRTRAQKKAFLSETRTRADYMRLFTQHDLDEESTAFRPTVNDYDREFYARFWAIHPESPEGPRADERCIFIRHCSGTKLAPTALFVHPRKPMLQRRSQEIGDMTKSYDELKTRWFSGQMKPPAENKLTPEVRQRIRTASGLAASYRRYAFRPFVCEQLLLDNELLRLLAGLGGGGTRLRPEVVSAYSDADTLGIAIAPSPIDIGEDLHRFATFCWDMPDNDLCARGNAHVFCNQFPDNKPSRGGAWDPEPKPNISEPLLARLGQVVPGITEKDVVFYTYAALCSGTLLEAFAPAYFTASSSENIPRIPVVHDAGILRFLVEKGRELAELENPRVEHALRPRISRLVEAFRRPFNLTNFLVDEEEKEIHLYANGGGPILILRDLPAEILRMTISGYDVIKCWLKFHSYVYTRAEFTRQDYLDFLGILSRLIMQTERIAEIDAVMDRIISGHLDLL